MKILYGLIADNGDGSNSINWYTNKTLVDHLLKNDEIYYGNEGTPAATLSFPDDLNLNELGILYIDDQSLEEWKTSFEI